MDDDIAGIFGALFTFVFWGFIVFAGIKSAKNKLYKSIPDEFKRTETSPSGGVKTGKFVIGKSTFNNMISIVEQAGSLYFKLPLGPNIAIPLSAIAVVKTTDGLFGSKSVVLSFANNAAPRIIFTIKESQVGQFPGLFSQTEQESSKEPDARKTMATYKQPSAIQTKTYKDSGPFRTFVFVVAVIVITYILFTQL